MSTALAPLGASGLLTLRDLMPRFLVWFKFVRQRASLTVDSYGFDLRTFLDFCDRAGLTRPDQVTFREVEMYLAWLRQTRKLKASSANRHLACLRTFFRYLSREGLARTNPAAAPGYRFAHPGYACLPIPPLPRAFMRMG